MSYIPLHFTTLGNKKGTFLHPQVGYTWSRVFFMAGLIIILSRNTSSPSLVLRPSFYNVKNGSHYKLPDESARQSYGS